MEACAVICRNATVALPDANFLSPWCQSPSFRAQNRHFCALLPASFFPTAPSASNKPHPAEKSTPVWLAIWHIWAGFANSQLQCATFHSNYSYKCTSTLLPPCNRCSDIANLSAHLHRLPTPPTYLRRMRLLPGRGAGVGWQMMLLVVRGTVPANHRACFKNVIYL